MRAKAGPDVKPDFGPMRVLFFASPSGWRDQMTFCIGRRELITLLGGAAAWPLAARAQQAAMPVIGYFSSRSSRAEGAIRGPFLKALEEFGFVAGHNVAIEYRFSEGRDEGLPQIAADLVGKSVSMLVATDRPSAMAAKAATATIPIVFTSGLDPVQIGLVASFNRPGGNATGVSLFSTELGPKRLGLLRELLPKSGTIAFVVNPNNTATPFQVREMQAAAQVVGQPLLVVKAGYRRAGLQSVRDDGRAQRHSDPLWVKPIFPGGQRATHCAGCALQDTRTLRMAGICNCWWPHELQHGSQ